MKPVVSVVIPTKNRAHYLSFAIQSVLNQTFEDFELLIVDAVSRDSTREVVSGFKDKRIRYIKEEIDRGPSASRNTGIIDSKGEFIAFLDDDDLWMPKKLEKQLSLFRKNQLVDVVYTGCLEFRDKGRILGYRIPQTKGNIFPRILMNNFLGNCSTVMVKKECFDKVGLFDERLQGFEDYDLWIRLAKYCQFDYVKEPLVLYRFHEKRITTNLNRIRKAHEILYKKYFKEIMMADDRKKIFGEWNCSRGVIHFKCGDMERGRTEFIRAICNNPFNIVYYVNLSISFFGLKAYIRLRNLLFSSLPGCFRFKIE